MAVTTVVLLALFVALFAPGTANSETEVADPENVAKAELVKKENTLLETRGKRNKNKKDKAGPRKNRKNRKRKPLPEEDPNTFLEHVADCFFEPGDRIESDIFNLSGEEELETRGRRGNNKKNKSAPKKNRKNRRRKPVPEEDPNTIVDHAADFIGTGANAVADLANGILGGIFGEEELETRGRRGNNKKNKSAPKKNRKNRRRKPVPEEDPNTIVDHAADFIGTGANAVADLANGILGGIFGEEELETRGRRGNNKKNKSAPKKNRKNRRRKPVPEEDPNTIVDHAADFIGNSANAVADVANGILGIFGEEELETRGRRGNNKKNKSAPKKNRKNRRRKPVPEEDPNTIVDHAADFIGTGANAVADLANGILGGIFGEEELETRGRRGNNKKNKSAPKKNRKNRRRKPVPEEDPNTILDHAADFLGNGADAVADLANGIFGVLGEEEKE
ncbi:uncharacterized protein LOC134822633 isoform X2 [Bolinopsis microptera]|uniref:uncharacterized protein LOC134822633 isoform X2 n=1 Tax=Bolinopsis microptera TaxID=2820187 RepID=UPI003078EB68